MALVQIPDETYAQYLALAEHDQQPVDTLIARQLARMAKFSPGKRIVILSGDLLHEIEQLIGGGGNLTTGPQLLNAVKTWAGVTIGHVRVNFTAAQLEEIGYRANKQNKTPNAVVEDIVAQLAPQFFDGPVPVR